MKDIAEMLLTKKCFAVAKMLVLELGMLLEKLGRDRVPFCYSIQKKWKDFLIFRVCFIYLSKIN